MGKITSLKCAVCRLVHASGYRFRVYRHDLPSTPDLIFRGWRKVIFTPRLRLHIRPDPDCDLARMLKSRQSTGWRA